jgi:hypothetical protein
MKKYLKTKQLVILVERNVMNIIPKRIYAHEIRVLRLMFGGEKIRLDPNFSLKNMAEVKLDRNEEYQRLFDLYGEDPVTNQPWVAKAFGEPFQADFEKGMEDIDELISDYSPEAPIPKIEYTINPSKLTKSAIIEELEKFDVEYPSDANKEELAETLRELWGMTEPQPA